MRLTNENGVVQGDKSMGLKGKIICGLSERISKNVVNPRECAFLFLYEPELPVEVLEEFITN